MSEKPEPNDDLATNPYAAPTSIAVADFLEEQELLPEPDPLRVIIKWLVVCTVAAGPSFFIGGGIGNWRTPEVLGMIVGILIFVAGYSAIEFMPQTRSAMAERAKRRAARIAYISRMGISILFPVGVFVDLYCGIASLGLASMLTGGAMGGFGNSANDSSHAAFRFFTFLLTTVIQGTLLNILVFTFMAIVYGVLRASGVKNSSKHEVNESTFTLDTDSKISQQSDGIKLDGEHHD